MKSLLIFIKMTRVISANQACIKQYTSGRRGVPRSAVGLKQAPAESILDQKAAPNSPPEASVGYCRGNKTHRCGAEVGNLLLLLQFLLHLSCAALWFPPCSTSRWLAVRQAQNLARASNSALLTVLSCGLLQNGKSCNNISSQIHWLAAGCWKKQHYGSTLRHWSLYSVFSWHQPHLFWSRSIFCLVTIYFSCKMKITTLAYGICIPSCALVRKKIYLVTHQTTPLMCPTHILSIWFHNQTHWNWLNHPRNKALLKRGATTAFIKGLENATEKDFCIMNIVQQFALYITFSSQELAAVKMWWTLCSCTDVKSCWGLFPWRRIFFCVNVAN